MLKKILNELYILGLLYFLYEYDKSAIWALLAGVSISGIIFETYLYSKEKAEECVFDFISEEAAEEIMKEFEKNINKEEK